MRLSINNTIMMNIIKNTLCLLILLSFTTALWAAKSSGAIFIAADKELQASRTRAIPGYPSANFCPHTGTIRVPVILMQYPDKDFSLDKDVIDEYFNGTTITDLSTETRF